MDNIKKEKRKKKTGTREERSINCRFGGMLQNPFILLELTLKSSKDAFAV